MKYIRVSAVLAAFLFLMVCVSDAVRKDGISQMEKNVRYEVYEPERTAYLPDEYQEENQEPEFYIWEVPEEYRRTGGTLPEEIQVFAQKKCREYGVSYPLILAMIERESGYRPDVTGDSEESLGYMQMKEMYHQERAIQIGAGDDLLDPYTNIWTAVDYLHELDENGYPIEEALMVYNCGIGTAESMWSHGIYSTDYVREVLNREKEISDDLYGGE